jgi:hypothetical protein
LTSLRIATVGLAGVQALWLLAGAMTSAAFDAYVTHVLGPTLQPGDKAQLGGRTDLGLAFETTQSPYSLVQEITELALLRLLRLCQHPSRSSNFRIGS